MPISNIEKALILGVLLTSCANPTGSAPIESQPVKTPPLTPPPPTPTLAWMAEFNIKACVEAVYGGTPDGRCGTDGDAPLTIPIIISSVDVRGQPKVRADSTSSEGVVELVFAGETHGAGPADYRQIRLVPPDQLEDEQGNILACLDKGLVTLEEKTVGSVVKYKVNIEWPYLLNDLCPVTPDWLNTNL